MADVKAAAEPSKRPEDSDWKQQRLPAWQPLLTPNWVIGTFAVVAIVFIPIGIGIIVTSNNVVELKQRYDDILACSVPSGGGSSTCSFNITVTEDMSTPIYFYYELSNYYQNHRRYVKSRSDEQLRGSLTASVASCTPIETRPVNGSSRNIVPCGLIANSFFNDSFAGSLCTNGVCTSLSPATTDDSYPSWKKKGIAWDTDVSDKFKYVPLDSTATDTSLDGFTLPRVDDEDFIVWMRTAGLPTFRKLYRINTDTAFKKGQVVRIDATNRYPVSQFDGTKSIVISTTSWLGGKNSFLGWAYIAVGLVTAVLAIAFGIKQWVSPRRLGDMQYFQWSSAGNKQLDED